MQIYYQFIDICNNLMKYITTQNLVYGALISIAFFLLWAALSVMTSSIRKFYVRCGRLEKYIKRNNIGYENLSMIDGHCRKISRSFAHGWNKFKRSSGKRPSDFLTKKEVLDAEVSDGMLNHGKTLMKTYIGITTVLLFILNLAQLGKDLAFTFNILVESMFMPFVYYVVMMLVFFIASLIKQQTYIIATAHFYSLVDSLDECFDIIGRDESNQNETSSLEVSYMDNENPKDEKLIENNETEQLAKTENQETTEQDVTSENNEPVEMDNKLEEEASETLGVNEEQPESEEIDDRNFEELENEETETVNFTDDLDEKIKEPEVEQYEVKDWEDDNIENYDIFKKKNINVDKYINEIPDENDHSSLFIDVDREVMPTDESVEETFEENQQEPTVDMVEETTDKEIFEEDVQENQETVSDEIDEIVGLDESEVLKETESEELDEETDGETSEDIHSNIKDEELDEYVANVQQNEDFDINQDEDADEFDFFSDINETENIDELTTEQENKQSEFKAQLEQNLNESTQEIDNKLENDSQLENLSSIVDEFKQNFHEEDVEEMSETENNSSEVANNNIDSSEAQKIYEKINDLEQLIHTAMDKGDEKDELKSTKTKKSKKGNKKMTDNNSTEKKTRGRPKMQAIDENLVITTEEQFEEILARAEKLMRKTEQGLSASQSKRIEKELKIMMDAMNKYKEG